MLTCRYQFQKQPPSMVNDYKGRHIHPSVVELLSNSWFKDSNAAMNKIMSKELGWGKPKAAAA